MLQVCDEDQINAVLRKCNNDDDDDDVEGVSDDSDNEVPLQ